MDALSLNARRSAILWLAGFREACSLHRVFIFCFSSKALAIRTGQCFLLNGLIFLGSFVMDIANIILSTMWYNDIARHAFEVLKRKGLHLAKVSGERASQDNQNGMYSSRPGGLEGVVVGIGEQVYSLLLLTFFFIEVVAALFIPYIGTPISFLLNAWMYAYYCFEYKWNLSELSLDKRLEFFESNWAFFAGFGSPCVLAIFFFSRLVSYGVMAILFPLFVLTAAGSLAEQVIDSIRGEWNGGGPGKVPIFYAADTLSMLVLRFIPNVRKEQ